MVDEARADVLLVTVTKLESKAVLAAFAGTRPKDGQRSVEGRVYFDLGDVNGARVWLTQSEMGTGGPGASLQVVEKGIDALSPAAVVMVGIAFGMSEEKQRIGDVLVTEQLRLYDLQRVGEHEGRPRIVLRGDKPHASPWLLNHLKGADLLWEGATVRFGTVLTGEKLVDNLDFREQLRAFEPEAAGGEMEGGGLYVACQDRKVDWILVKAICDWADGNKAQDKDERQGLAAKNAAAFVLHALQFARIDWDGQRRAARAAAVVVTNTGAGAVATGSAVASGAGGVSVGGSVGQLVVHTPAVEVRAACRSTLPQQPFFFGREEELATIADAIAAESRTWGVLIDGPGGIGKTSLAVRAAHLAPERDFDGKIFLSAKVRELTATGEQKLEDYLLPNYLALLTELAAELGNKDLARLPESERVNVVRRDLAGRRALLVIDNVETFPETERVRLGQFLSRLPQGCKAIVTSRRRTDVDARIVRLDRLALKDALALLDALAETNRRLSTAGPAERKRLYELTGGNALLLRWTVAQLGRSGSQCRTVDEACAFLEHAPPGNDPLEYIFGDLLDTFTDSETKVLAALAHFSLPAEVGWISDVAGLAERQARTALEDLGDRSLLIGDASGQAFVLPPLTASYLRRKRPEAITQTGDRLMERAVALALENGFNEYDRFPILEAGWSAVAAALPLLLQGDNGRLQKMCDALRTFQEFSGRWDERLWLSHRAEMHASTAGDSYKAGWRASDAGYAYSLLGQAASVLACAGRAAAHWQNAGARERSIAIRLRGLGHKLDKNYPAAIDAYSQSLALRRTINPQSGDVALILNSLGIVERETENYSAAERNFRQALQIANKNNDRDGITIYTNNLAELALAQADWHAAERLAREAIILSEAIGRQEGIGSSCHILARALARQGKSSEGLPYAQRAVEICSRLRKPDDLEEAQAALHECTQADPPPPTRNA